MVSYRWVFLLFMAAALGLPVKAATTKKKTRYALDQEIAKYAIILGTNRLARDISDPEGLRLVKIGSTIDPKNDAALLTMGYVDRNHKPNPIKTTVDEAKLVDVIIKRAKVLADEQLVRNARIGKLCRLYAVYAERTKATDPTVVLLLTKLSAKGFKQDLDDLLATPLDLEDIFANPEAPPELEYNIKLNKKDFLVGKVCGILGTNRLAEATEDPLGLQLVQLAGEIDPESDQVYLSMGLMFREQKPIAVKTTYTDKQLKGMLISRAQEIGKRKEQVQKELELALLYYRMAERLGLDDRIVLGVAKLKANGVEGELTELLTEVITTRMVEPQEDVADADEAGDTALTKGQLRNIDIDGSAKRTSLKKSEDYKPTEILVKTEIDNRNTTEFGNMSAAILVISTPTKSRKSFIVTERKDIDDLTLSKSGTVKLEELKTTCYEYTDRYKKYARPMTTPQHRESVYYGYVVALFDEDGKLVKTELSQNSSLLRDIISEVTEMEADWLFDKDGKVTDKDPEIPRITGTDLRKLFDRRNPRRRR